MITAFTVPSTSHTVETESTSTHDKIVTEVNSTVEYHSIILL